MPCASNPVQGIVQHADPASYCRTRRSNTSGGVWFAALTPLPVCAHGCGGARASWRRRAHPTQPPRWHHPRFPSRLEPHRPQGPLGSPRPLRQRVLLAPARHLKHANVGCVARFGAWPLRCVHAAQWGAIRCWAGWLALTTAMCRVPMRAAQRAQGHWQRLTVAPMEALHPRGYVPQACWPSLAG
jgi:hypothetical protein